MYERKYRDGVLSEWELAPGRNPPEHRVARRPGSAGEGPTSICNARRDFAGEHQRH
jgi:hypothetical protein